MAAADVFPPSLPFAGNPLDRASALRKNEGWVAEQRVRPDAELVVLRGGDVLHERGVRGSRLLFLTAAALSELPGAEPVLLGLRREGGGGVPVFAVDGTDGHAATPPFSDLGAYGPLRTLAAYLPPDELAVAGQAAWLLDWHRRHRFCARHGGPTVMAEGGGKRVHLETDTEHFPRTDPVAIVLPVLDDEVCLGRGPRFPPGVFSAFAGFMEAGETLEECAARELHEEAGLTAATMRYRFGQPWPFPASLMVGFEAAVTGRALKLDPEEIAEARWFTREEASALLAGEGPEGASVPPPLAIAHHLLRAWVES